jgi:hypothetical protein
MPNGLMPTTPGTSRPLEQHLWQAVQRRFPTVLRLELQRSLSCTACL